jgi:hypothetical protein
MRSRRNVDSFDPAKIDEEHSDPMNAARLSISARITELALLEID